MTTTIANIMSSHISIFVVTIILSVSAFRFGATSVNNISKNKVKIFVPCFAVLNGLIYTCGSIFFYQSPHPLFAIFIFAFLIWIEIKFFTHDTNYIFLYLVLGLLLMELLAYSFMLIIFCFANKNSGLYALHINDVAISASSFLFAAIYLLLVQFKFVKMENFKQLIHSKEQGLPLLFYFIGFDIATTISITLVRHLLYFEYLPLRILMFILAILFSKDFIVLVTSLLLVTSGCNSALLSSNNEKYNMELRRERFMRNAAHRNKIIEYTANTSKNIFIEGSDFFSKEYFGENPYYIDAMSILVKNCIHPEDMVFFSEIGTSGFYETKLLHNPFYSLRFRISPKAGLKFLNLPEETKEHLLSYKKKWIYMSFNCTVLPDENSEDILLHAEIEDVDKEVSSEQQLLDRATKDSLTGIFNRRTVKEKIDSALKEGIENAAMFIIDLDVFKPINDKYGHPVGDVILKETASIINKQFRKSDIVGRLGGDEFIVFAFGFKNEDMIKNRAEILCGKLCRNAVMPDGSKMPTSASIGIAVYPSAGNNYTELYNNADSALYEAKENGKNTFCFYNKSK